MKRAAVYARYSTDLQRETSLDDQIKRCHEIAQRHGYQVSNDLIFTDAALSGTSKHTALREGYQKLLAALEDGKIDVLIVDEFSRLSRDAVDQAQLMRFFEENLKFG